MNGFSLFESLTLSDRELYIDILSGKNEEKKESRHKRERKSKWKT